MTERRHEPQSISLMQAWWYLGSIWLWLGMALAPVNSRAWNPGKFYHQSLVLMYLPPLLWWCWQQRQTCKALLRDRYGCLLGLCLGWSSLGLLWSQHGNLGDGLGMELGLGLFVLGTASSLVVQPSLGRQLLFLAGLGIAGACLIAMLWFPYRAVVWVAAHRMVGFGTWNNPNLAGMGAGAALLWLWLAPWPPADGRRAAPWATLLLLIFIAWTGSRASWLALALAAVTASLLHMDRLRWSQLWLGVGAALLGVCLGWHQLMARGWSYRPQIFSQALQQVLHTPWLGIGTTSRYQVRVGAQQWEHSHNVWTHLAITLGLPGLALWAGLWFWTGWRAWRGRQQAAGRGLAVLWVYASVATCFDAPLAFVQPNVEWALLWLPVAMAWALGPQHVAPERP